MRNQRKNRGFTLIELLVAVVIIGILAAIALPNFVGAQGKAKTSQVRSNMHVCHVAAESYATDMAGVYPPSAAAAGPYYPHGGNSPGGAPGIYPLNPYSNANDPPIDGAIGDVAAARAQIAGSTSGPAGCVSYSAIPAGVATTYAVIGFDNGGKSVAGSTPNQCVLSNQ